MDRIEISNLSRQFLFRQHDVGSPKSVSGDRVVKGWSPQMNIEALERKVGPDSEDFFDDKFSLISGTSDSITIDYVKPGLTNDGRT